MSVRRPVELSDHHRLPSKRKLNDCAPLDSDDHDSFDLVRMRKPDHLPSDDFTPDLLSRSATAASSDRLSSASTVAASTASTATASDRSSPSLHFFIRAMSKKVVVHANPLDKVGSLIELMKNMTRMRNWEMRFIYRGRELQSDRTLAEYGVENDACIELTGRLRSTRFPQTWQIVNDLISSICWLGNGASDDPIRAAAKEKYIYKLVKKFLSTAPAIPYPSHKGNDPSHEGNPTLLSYKGNDPSYEENPTLLSYKGNDPSYNYEGEIDETWGHLNVFVASGATTALVKLYLSLVPGNCTIAEKAIRFFFVPSSDYPPKCIQTQCVPIVLEFCKLLAATAGKRDPLYTACRNTLASLLEVKDSKYFVYSNPLTMISDLFPFVSELAGIVMEGLSMETMHTSCGDLTEFSNFLHAMLRAIHLWLGKEIPIPKAMYTGLHPLGYEWMPCLHATFLEILGKTDQWLEKVEVFLAQKGPIQCDSRWATWAHLLQVLTELNCFSQFYEGDGKSLHAVLVARRLPLNALIRRAKRNDSLRWLLKHKDLTDFEARQHLVLMMFPEGRDDYDELHEMLIDRSQLLAESFEYISQAEPSALHGGIFMEFKNEEATGPGVLREWFCLLCRAIFNPQNVLFLPCPNDRRRFFPNPASVVDPLHLKYFGFCGRVIALALMHKVQVGIVFDRVFFLQLAGKTVTLNDIQDADPCLYMSCKKVMEMDVELLDSDILGLTFIREIEELGAQRAVELCPGGKDIVVNSKNREEYVNSLIEHHFVTSISGQVSRFAKGFSDILSKSERQEFFFQSLDLEDFDRMLGGSDSVINVREWKTHTEYNGYKAKDRQICWFWKIVEGMPAEQKRVLLFFWTSVKYLPVNGFSGLDSKLYIYKTSDSHDRLPTSHTCFYRLCLPPYSSISIMRDRLHLITQEHVSCSFGTW